MENYDGADWQQLSCGFISVKAYLVSADWRQLSCGFLLVKAHLISEGGSWKEDAYKKEDLENVLDNKPKIYFAQFEEHGSSIPIL